MKILLTILTFLIIGSNYAQTNIKVGEKAPVINITHWIKNVPDDKILTDKYIVLEFWATWCGPCIAAVPHMNEIQDKFKNDDLIFLSLTDENIEKVERTLKRVDFKSTVVSDISKKTLIEFGNGKNGLEAYPLTVLIDNTGIIQWIGEPNQLSEELMQSFLAGSDSKSSLSKISSKNKIIEFDDLRTDKSIEYYFHFSQTDSNESSVTSLGNNFFEIKAKTLEQIYSQIFNNIHVDIPSEIRSEKFNLTYKNLVKSNALERLEEEILDYLQLSKRKFNKEIEVFELEISNQKLLEPAIDKSFSSKSGAGEKMIFTNTDIKELVSELSKIHNIDFQYKKKYKKTYDFIIEVTTLNNTIESLESYGIKTHKLTKKIEADLLEVKK
jgi:thiol-disulfide isomerase/thioredoxin